MAETEADSFLGRKIFLIFLNPYAVRRYLKCFDYKPAVKNLPTAVETSPYYNFFRAYFVFMFQTFQKSRTDLSLSKQKATKTCTFRHTFLSL